MASAQEQIRLRELSDFLRTRRNRLTPDLVGLPAGGRRRTPGLRRAEVAQLAGISVDLYTWLEQGRSVGVSDQVLEGLVQALQLNADERAHLFLLAHRQTPPDKLPSHRTVSATLQHFLDGLDPSPAFAVGPCWDIVAWNQAACVTLYDFAQASQRERNILWRMFTAVNHRRLVADWEKHARRVVAQFRSSYGRFPGDPWMKEIIHDLQDRSPEFCRWWSAHEVLGGIEGKKVLKHPLVGPLTFEHLQFQLYNEPDIKVVVYTPLDEDGTAAKIRQLLATRRLPS